MSSSEVPVPLDVDAVERILIVHRLFWGYTVDVAVCACGWQTGEPMHERGRQGAHRRHLAAVIAGVGETS